MNFAPDSGLLSRYFGGWWRMGKLQCRAKFSGSRRAAYWFNKQLFALRRLTLTPPAGSILSKLGTFRGGDFLLGKFLYWTRRSTGP